VSSAANTASIVGQLLDGRYRVGARIASGGMATVYAALDTRLDREVAVKVLDADLARDPGFERRFVHEAKAAARLSHPNVVAVFDQGHENLGPDGSGDTLYLVMELVHGQTLRKLLTSRVRLPAAEALRITADVLAALSAAHEAGLVHRDVKPENVLLDESGRVKVADFGLARALVSSDQSTTRGVVLGTVSYLAPEQVERGRVDERTDIYATGILAYELLTGERPYEGDNPLQVAYQHVHSRVPAPSILVPDLPVAVDRLVVTATARDPADRYQDAGSFAEAVRAVTTDLAHGQREVSRSTRRLRTPTDTADLTAEGDPSGRDASSPGPLIPLFAEDDPAPPAPPRRRRRRWPFVLLGVLVLIPVAAFAGYSYLMTQYTQAPDISGLTISKARALAGEHELTIDSSIRKYSESVAAGHVIKANPATGERVHKHTTISVVVSKGPERFDVPALTGKTVRDAEDLLTAQHLELGKTTGRYDEQAAKGTVLSTDPDAGTALRRGTAVNLVVSKGRKPIDVPRLAGHSAQDAVTALTKLHLTVKQTRQFSGSVPEGNVISQTPDHGTRYRGDTVTLVVSKGPQMVTVPGVRGQGVDSATGTLEGVGLHVRVEHAQLYVGAGLVVAQSPGGDEVVPKGTTVVLTIV